MYKEYVHSKIEEETPNQQRTNSQLYQEEAILDF